MPARVLLFNPPGPKGRSYTREGRCTQEPGIWGTLWPPVTLATAAALLEKDGHEVRVIDFPASGKGIPFLEKVLAREAPEYVFWATGTPTLAHDLGLAGIVKRCAPRAFTGVMGTHVSNLPDEALGRPEGAHPDVVVRGEPEQTIRNLCAVSGERRFSVKGISFPDPATGKVVHNPDAEFMPAGEIPAPAWHRLDLDPYRLPFKGSRFLITAPVRGCPYACSFCTAPVYYGKKVRKRPAGQVADELRKNVTRHGVRDFFFWADTFTVDSGYVLQLCEEILARGLDISWSCNSRVDTVTPDLLAAMKRAGLWMISFGIESANDRVLKSCGKGITVGQSVSSVRAARGLGIRTAGHFMFGLPRETEESMAETLRLALELPLDIAQFYAAAPFPGTELYKEALRKGWLREGLNFSQGIAGLDLPGLSGSKVDEFRRQAYRAFYTRPGTVRNLLTMLRPGGVGLLVRNAAGFLRQALL